MKIEITRDGLVIGKGRPRFTRSGHVFTPAKTKKYEDSLKALAQAEMDRRNLDVIDCGCSMVIFASFEIQKSWTKKKRELAQNNLITPKKPDIDNIAKAVLDAFNKVIYVDDSLVSSLNVVKVYGNPYLKVTIIKD